MPRLDLTLVALGLAPTRSRALDLVRRGYVSVDGRVTDKAGAEIAETAKISVASDAPSFVSRGAEKLNAALDHFAFGVAGLSAADIGASTGGFTEVLLMRGARHVTAVDVGRDQLAQKLRDDARVTVFESTDARTLTGAHFPQPPQAIVADVSFISLEKALPVVLRLAAPGAWTVLLIKPQFEVGPENVGKGGIVRDAAAITRAVQRIATWLQVSGLHVLGTLPSPIAGGDGNQEFLIGARKPVTGPHA